MEVVSEALKDISPVDLKQFRGVYEVQVRRGPPSEKAQFDYARCLVRSVNKADVHRGIRMLTDLFNMTSGESAKRDYLFFISIGHTRLKNYDEALRYCTAILNVEPRNQCAIYLEEYIRKSMRTDGFIGMAIVGGATALMIGGIIGVGVALSRR